jgi:hypothetical protein
MRKFTLLLVGGLLFLAACVPATPAPLTIPQTGNTAQPADGATTAPGAGINTSVPGSSLTIIPPGTTDAAPGTGTWTPVPGTEDQTNAFTATAQANQAGQGAVTSTPAVGQDAITSTPAAGQGTSGIPRNDPQPTDIVPPTTNVITDYDYSDFLGELRGQSGLTVEERGQVQEPFFSVGGRQVRMNNADVTVFEFPDAASHQAALDTITENGGIIGAVTPAWGARPNFYSKGNLIALYLGSEQETLDQLQQRFGEPLTYANQVGGISADTAFRLQSSLSELLNVGLDQIRIVEVSQQNWPDACLGLSGANEFCSQVVTPGYSVIVEVGGTRYTIRTNQTGSVLRFQQQ